MSPKTTSRLTRVNCPEQIRKLILIKKLTVFIDSIHMASTGPSQQIHFLAVSPSATALHASRTIVEMMPSVHSIVICHVHELSYYEPE